MGLNLPTLKSIFSHSKETTEGITEKERKVQKELFVYPVNPPTELISFFGTIGISENTDTSFNIFLAEDFSTLDEIVIIIRPDTTETINFDINVSRAKKGETHNNSNTSNNGLTQEVIINEITELDITKQIKSADIERGDYLGIQIESNTTGFGVLGLRIRYS